VNGFNIFSGRNSDQPSGPRAPKLVDGNQPAGSTKIQILRLKTLLDPKRLDVARPLCRGIVPGDSGAGSNQSLLSKDPGVLKFEEERGFTSAGGPPDKFHAMAPSNHVKRRNFH
jgi:hypothetical protein